MVAHCEAAPAKSLVADWHNPGKVLKLDKNYQSLEVVAQRQATLDLLNVQPGERVLDVGCGPGFLLVDIADAVGLTGRAEGLDPSEAMRAKAQERLGGRAKISDGSAERLPYEDGSFDLVVYAQTLLYVADVPKALAECRRVLRPGGRLLILDTDWDSLIVNTSDPERFARVRAAACSTFVDAHLPPKVPGLLARAGLVLEQVRTVPMVAAGRADDTGGSFVGNWAFKTIVEKMRDFGLPKSEVEDWLAEQRRLNAEGAFFACVHRFLFLARKPE